MVVNRLEEVRKEKGMSIYAFEKALGYSNSGFKHALDKQRNINEEKIRKAVKTFDLDLHWLVFGG